MYALNCAKILNELGTEIFLHINELLLQYNFFNIVRLGKSLFWGIVTVISLSSVIINFRKLTNVIVVLVQS